MAAVAEREDNKLMLAPKSDGLTLWMLSLLLILSSYALADCLFGSLIDPVEFEFVKDDFSRVGIDGDGSRYVSKRAISFLWILTRILDIVLCR